MKGQYVILGEMFLFAIGIIVVSYIIMVFGSLNTSISKESTGMQLFHVGNYLKTGIAKLFSTKKSNMRIKIPKNINQKTYYLYTNDSEELVVKIVGEDISATIDLFDEYDIVMANNRITSASEYVDIKKDGNNITIMRE